MNINKENWSAFAVDYYDGNLSPEQERELFVFLEQNPVLKAEFEQYEPFVLEPETITFPGTDKLKKNETDAMEDINEENYRQFFVLYHDDELSPAQKAQTEQFLRRNPHLKEEFEIWKEIRLVPDKTVVFKDKDSLKRQRRLIPVWVARLAAAAVLLPLLMLLWPYLYNQNSGGHVSNTKISAMQRKPVSFTLSGSIALSDIQIKYEKVVVKNIPYQVNPVKESSVEMISLIPKAGIQSNLTAYEDINNRLILKNETSFFTDEDVLIVKDDSRKSKNPLFRAITKPFGDIQKALAMKKRNRKRNGRYDPPALKVIEGGIAAFNAITGAQVVTAKVYNADGRLTHYGIAGNNWQINRKMVAKGEGGYDR